MHRKEENCEKKHLKNTCRFECDWKVSVSGSLTASVKVAWHCPLFPFPLGLVPEDKNGCALQGKQAVCSLLHAVVKSMENSRISGFDVTPTISFMFIYIHNTPFVMASTRLNWYHEQGVFLHRINRLTGASQIVMLVRGE